MEIIIINFSEDLIYPAEILKKRILDRSKISVYFNKEFESKFSSCDRIYNIYLKTDEKFENDYKIENCDFQTIITGSNFINLIGGIGKFLHNTKFYNDYIIPCDKNYNFKAKCEYRCIYFANHFYNYYQLASDESIKIYIEDIALWGYNNIASILIPTINLFGKDDKNVDWFVKCAKRIYDNTKALGMKYTALSLSNGDFKNQNPDIIAKPLKDPYGSRGSLGERICPNAPGAMEYIKDLYNWIFEKLSFEEIDYMVVWPYDEGGCGCEKCYPWVPRGLMKIFNEMKEDIQKRYPNIKYILALWRMVDDETQEWEETVNYLNNHQSDFEYIMLNNEHKFEQYPVHNHIPGKKINFTEISMWCFMPWGGFGANPYPNHIRELLEPCISELNGCMLYSEGPFEDINKVICSYVMDEKDFKYKDILREYINYEYSSELVEDITELIMYLEKIHRDYGYEANKIYDKRLCRLVKELSEDINKSPYLRSSWKWRMLYIRAQTEESRMAYLTKNDINNDNWPEIVKNTDKIFTERELDLLRELRDIYEFTGKYTGTDTDTHIWLAPPVKN